MLKLPGIYMRLEIHYKSFSLFLQTNTQLVTTVFTNANFKNRKRQNRKTKSSTIPAGEVNSFEGTVDKKIPE